MLFCLFFDLIDLCETSCPTLVYNYLYTLLQYLKSTASIFIDVKSRFCRKSNLSILRIDDKESPKSKSFCPHPLQIGPTKSVTKHCFELVDRTDGVAPNPSFEFVEQTDPGKGDADLGRRDFLGDNYTVCMSTSSKMKKGGGG